MRGSPPHTWGTVYTLIRPLTMQGITPTYVGNSGLSLQPPIPPPDHPHTRGEQSAIEAVKAIASGSPPHTWGTVSSTPSSQTKSRITPTHVGNRPACSQGSWSRRDHPHTRGEQQKPWGKKVHYSGSPPHTWGTD